MSSVLWKQDRGLFFYLFGCVLCIFWRCVFKRTMFSVLHRRIMKHLLVSGACSGRPSVVPWPRLWGSLLFSWHPSQPWLLCPPAAAPHGTYLSAGRLESEDQDMREVCWCTVSNKEQACTHTDTHLLGLVRLVSCHSGSLFSSGCCHAVVGAFGLQGINFLSQCPQSLHGVIQVLFTVERLWFNL